MPQPSEARDTLMNLHAVWQRPVHIMTIVNEAGKILSFDGEDYSESATDESGESSS